MKKFLHIDFGKVDLDLLFIPTAVFAVCMGYFEMFAVSFLSILIHECSHIAAAKFVGVGISKLEIHPFGVSALLKDGYINNSEKEFFIAFAGPFTSIIIAVFALIFPIYEADYVFMINICICAINLLPALPLDGGRMIKSMLTSQLGIIRAYSISQKSGKILLSLFIPFSVFVMVITRFNFTYVLISAFLLGNIYSEQRNITMVTVREIMGSSKKVGAMKKTRVFTAAKGESARKILRFISFDYDIVVNIFENGKITATLSETEILDGLLTLGISATYGDICKKT